MGIKILKDEALSAIAGGIPLQVPSTGFGYYFPNIPGITFTNPLGSGPGTPGGTPNGGRVAPSQGHFNFSIFSNPAVLQILEHDTFVKAHLQHGHLLLEFRAPNGRHFSILF